MNNQSHDCTPGTCDTCDYLDTLQSLAASDGLTQTPEEWAHNTGAPPPTPTHYTDSDAFQRVQRARIGCLAPDQVTPAYLLKLSGEIYKWHDEVQQELARRGIEAPA